MTGSTDGRLDLFVVQFDGSIEQRLIVQRDRA
jgi:hypothetical protein